MAQILGFVFAGASTVTALAMLLLVVWQAPRHRHNRLMAVYLATLVLWGATNLVARACALVGCSPDLFTYGAVALNGINAFVLFWFVTDYVGLSHVGTTFVPFFTQTVSSSNPTDIFASFVP